MSDDKKILAVLPRGEAMRNFVYSGCLDQVRRRVGLSTLAVKPEADLWEELKERLGEIHELSGARDKAGPRYVREILDVAHGRYVWSEAAKNRWFLRDVEAEGISAKLKRVVKKALCRPLANRVGMSLLDRLEAGVSRWCRSGEEYMAQLKQARPGLVFNGSHVHALNAVPVIHAAKRLGITTATFLFSWDNLTSQGRVMPRYDYYFAWNERIKRDCHDIYPFLKDEQVIVTGTPQFDGHFNPEFEWSRERFCSEMGLDPKRPIVFYSSGMANHMPGEPRIVEGIADMLKRYPGDIKPQLLMRVYPKDRTDRFDELRRRRRDIVFQKVPWSRNWLTPLEADQFVLGNSLRHCDVGINVASTVTLELCMFDRPVINVGYNPPGIDIHPVDYTIYYGWDHYKPIVDSGALDLAADEEEMEQMIHRALREPARLKSQRAALIKSFFGDCLDGRCGRRIADLLIDISGR